MSGGETFVLVDIESDGPVPGRHSMLSFAAVAFRLDRTVLGTFERNLEPLPGASQYPPTMAWWKKFPEAWAACRENQVPPAAAMEDFIAWVRTLPRLPAVFVANPISYDWLFMHYYMHSFTGFVHSITDDSPFTLAALDMHSYAMATLGRSFRGSGRSNYPAAWSEHNLPHTHKAIDDALEHAMTFCAMVQTNAALHEKAGKP